MSRRQRQAAAPRIYEICSLLLSYPDTELVAMRPALAAKVEELPPSPAREALGRFLNWWTETSQLAAEQHYVETIDLHKRSGLYLTFYGEGDKRERGAALLRLKQLYRSAGLPLGGTELPDYLPVMLEFAASAPDGRGEIVLREHRAALELVRLSLTEDESPYAELVDAVCLTLGDISVAESARVRKLIEGGPPQELVGLEPFAPPEVMPVAEVHR
ncbi:MAG: nitrate reductase molybdenum cofactor assembly chaperone [Solirubrobacterales bacterium]